MKQRHVLLWPALAAATVLTACGGGGSEAPAPAPADPLAAVPATASQSSGGMAEYLKALSRLAPEDREPAALDGYVPPTADDAEPEPMP